LMVEYLKENRENLAWIEQKSICSKFVCQDSYPKFHPLLHHVKVLVGCYSDVYLVFGQTSPCSSYASNKHNLLGCWFWGLQYTGIVWRSL
jgi:hypothetical protein